MLINKRLIKTNNGSIDYNQFLSDSVPHVKQIYSQTGKEIVEKFICIDNIEFISNEKAFSDNFYLNSIKDNFNSLKENFDVLFFGYNYFLCAVPYNFIVMLNMFDELDKLIKKSEYGIVLENIILYSITKDLKYINSLCETRMDIPLKVLDLCKENSVKAYVKILEIIKTNWKYNGNFHNVERKINEAHSNKLGEIQGMVEGSYGKKKNIVIFHLESLSNEIYFNNRDKLGNLTELLDSSMNFTRFYTSASSSVMSLFDLFYGNDFETDNYSDFEHMYPEETHCTHMFQILKDKSYNTLGIGFNETPDVEETNSSNVWNVEGQRYVWKETFEEFLNESTDFIEENSKSKTPFAIHMWNLLTHSGHFDDETKEVCTYDKKCGLSFISLDIMIEKTMRCLKELNLLEDTIIVCYGDHGDDLWSRGINSGFTHVTAPHSNLIWTPGAIYDSRIGSFLFNNIASMVDIKGTVLYLAGIDFKETFKYQGINLIKEKNEFIYSRSLLYNQREHQRIGNPKMIALNGFSSIETKDKALSVISEKYNLVASSKGLELYLYLTDPFNRNNLLNFIEFDGDFIPRKFNNNGAWRGHFRKIMLRDSQVYEIIYNLNLLKKKLKERISIKNEMVSNTEKNLFNMDNFTKISERGFK